MRLYKHSCVWGWYAYDIKDVCKLFDVHEQTVRAWIKAGLPVIDKKKPMLIYGFDLKTFIKAQNDNNKCKTQFDEIYCMKCRDACSVFQNNITVQHKNNGLHVNGQCRNCKTSMFKHIRWMIGGVLSVLFMWLMFCN